MSRPIAYDLVRLAVGPFVEKPRGIDRIDFGLCSRFFESWPGECMGVLPTPWGVRWVPRERIRKALTVLEAMWHESRDPESDPVLSRLKDMPIKGASGGAGFKAAHAIQGSPGFSWRNAGLSRRIRGMGRFLQLVAGERWSLGHPVDTLPSNTAYINIGHFGLSVPWLLSWLDRRPDIASLFMVHDIIPFEHPDLVAVSTLRSHHAVFKATMRHADAILVPSEAVVTAIEGELSLRGSRPIPTHAVRLPVDDLFFAQISPDPQLTKRPYFVAVGAIEPRKNLSMLFQIWPQLIRELGPDRTPRLILACTPGYDYSSIASAINLGTVASGHVVLAPGLSSPALAKLVAGARALLMPSVAEGFGLPPVEALSLGTPVVVSDIPAHREAVGPHGLFLDPGSSSAWQAAIAAVSCDGPAYDDLSARAAKFIASRWPSYMDQVGAIIEGMAPM